jgi:hypothetical protein
LDGSISDYEFVKIQTKLAVDDSADFKALRNLSKYEIL